MLIEDLFVAAGVLTFVGVIVGIRFQGLRKSARGHRAEPLTTR